MAKDPAVDLTRDAQRVLGAGWLEPDERLIEAAPVWGLPALDGVPKPPWPADQLGRRAVKVVGLTLLWIAGSVVVLIVLLVLADGMGGGGGESGSTRTKGPAVVLHGRGRESLAGRLATPALRRRGWWVFTNRRVAFVAPRGKVAAKFWSGSGPENEFAGPVPVDTVAEVRDTAYTYEGDVDRVRRTRFLRRRKPAGLYKRVRFADGSGVDFRRRHQ
ncbi:hypothetical protein GCM10009830_02320 [Glycomyces endophyticus]|uniref:DUF4178 domain-containing protein n=1 Tax=Glycomyces endophyticus TaxID=480996 RepID=A0ABP4RS18_9ACTN